MKIYQEKIKTEIVKENLKQSVQNLDQEIKDARKKGLELILATDGNKPLLQNIAQSLQEKIVLVLNSLTEDKIKNARIAHLTKSLRILSENLTKMVTGADKVVEHRHKSINININLKEKSKEELLQILNNYADKNKN